jgi:hypothetical protein
MPEALIHKRFYNDVTRLVMHPQNRDLLVLTKKETMNAQELEHEVELLVNLLSETEKIDVFCIANEIIDLNRYKIISKPYLIQKIIRQRKLRSFIFLSNKN